jgi:hypothetical protein
VALLVFLVYGMWLLGVFWSGHDVRDFIHMGHRYVFVAGTNPLFEPDPHYPYAVRNDGYDGQFSYYIAVDPVGARLHLDRVNYRYTRIVYPMAARLLSLGQVGLIPYALVLINWLAIAGGTLVVAAWLKRRGLSAWLAVVYGLSPGLFICLQRDLEEPLAYGLVALAVYLYGYGGRRRIVWSGLTFALAILTRESTALFPVVLGLGLLFEQGVGLERSRWTGASRAALLLALALGPFALYKGFLLYWLSPTSPMLPPALFPRLVPFSGLFSYWPWHVHQIEVFIAVVVPDLICAGVALWLVRRRMASIEVWLLLANVQLFVVMLNRLSYENMFGSARIALGVVLAAVLCLPAIDRCLGQIRAWLWLSAAFWFAAWPALLPLGDQLPTLVGLLLGLGSILLFWTIVERKTIAPTWAAVSQWGAVAVEPLERQLYRTFGWQLLGARYQSSNEQSEQSGSS